MTAFRRWTLWSPVVLACFAGLVPVTRAFLLVEVSYNEGWNVYNAQTVARGGLLYPVQYGWTTVNYPMLSFWLLATLHRVTHEYLFTARAVSVLGLLACAWMIAVAVERMGGSRWAGWLAGLFCWTAFCTEADYYVGVDDPQMLAQAVLVAGFALYLGKRRSFGRLAAVALVMVLGLFVKHSQIDLPLAVGLDLLLTAWPMSLWFAGCCGALVLLGTALTIHFGGPFFVAQMLAPRTYSLRNVPRQFQDVVGPLLVVFVAGAYTAWRQRRDESRRAVSILLVTAVAVGGYFSGGDGVSINCLFSVLAAMSMLLGLLLDDVARVPWQGWRLRVARIAPALCFGWLLIPLGTSGLWNPPGKLRQAEEAQRRFREDMAYLNRQPGPALCESLLLCFEAGKPYVYDPFNAARLLHFGKLDGAPMVQAIREGRFGAVQTDTALDRNDLSQRERFAPALRQAIESSYVPGHADIVAAGGNSSAAEDWILYVPRARRP